MDFSSLFHPQMPTNGQKPFGTLGDLQTFLQSLKQHFAPGGGTLPTQPNPSAGSRQGVAQHLSSFMNPLPPTPAQPPQQNLMPMQSPYGGQIPGSQAPGGTPNIMPPQSPFAGMQPGGGGLGMFYPPQTIAPNGPAVRPPTQFPPQMMPMQPPRRLY